MPTTTVRFAIADEDRERLERLVQHFGGGDRSEFLKATIRVMESEAATNDELTYNRYSYH
jgi:hypothetical protein